MTSKVIGSGRETQRLIRFVNLFKGINAVVYGYTFSSLLYFYAYISFKESWHSHLNTDLTLVQTLYTSFFSSAAAEMCALWLYYPFDLIKTRMQTSNHTYMYHNLADAFIKIWQPQDNKIKKASRFYSGMSLYGLTYTSFIAVEFATYEVLEQWIQSICPNGVINYLL
jgi:hypothetical protein